MANSVDPDQPAPIGAVCSGSTLFASILNSSDLLGNYLQQTTSADDIFRCLFSCNGCSDPCRIRRSSRKNSRLESIISRLATSEISFF